MVINKPTAASAVAVIVWVAIVTVESDSQAASTRVVVLNRLGMHARPAMTFVNLAGTFACQITVRKGEHCVDGKSMLQMLGMVSPQGTEFEITAQGTDAQHAIDQLKALVERKFDEETD